MHYPLTMSTFGPEEKAAMKAVIDSDRFTMGEHVKQFEQELASYFGAKHAVMTSSGSTANLIAAAALFYRKDNPLQPGDEIIAPCISWSTTFYPFHQYGLKFKFVDVDLATLNMDPSLIEGAITEKTRAIVSVSILGNPAPYDTIHAICEKHNLIHFDDNCESMGARFNGTYTGTTGLINTFSTFFSHHISTTEGGFVLTDDFELYCICKALRAHGWTRDQDPDSPLYEKKSSEFYESYRFILPGYNVRPGELQASAGLCQIKKLAEFIKIRRANARYFQERFAADPRFIIQKENGESSWFCFTMIVNPDSGVSRDQVLERLKKNNIEFRIITGGNILQHDVIKYFNYTCDTCDKAQLAHNNGFFVGNFPADIRDKIDHLYTALKDLN